jgi:hypothetical protein
MTVRTRAAATPLWVRALVAVLLVGAPAWWLADRFDRAGNERRLAVIATGIAKRPVEVSCPGFFARTFLYEIRGGSVSVDEHGRLSDTAELRDGPCAELDALAEGERAAELACAERSTSCGDDVQAVARAVDVLAHEAWHLRGILDEAETECRSLQTMAWTAQQLGATEAQGRSLARMQYEVDYPLMPEQYRSGECRDGGAGDLRPDDPRWP